MVFPLTSWTPFSLSTGSAMAVVVGITIVAAVGILQDESLIMAHTTPSTTAITGSTITTAAHTLENVFTVTETVEVKESLGSKDIKANAVTATAKHTIRKPTTTTPTNSSLSVNIVQSRHSARANIVTMASV